MSNQDRGDLAPSQDGLHVRLEQSAPIRLEASFTCEPGEILALVGPSGAGKTSILRAIAGLLTPKHGLIQSGSTVWFSDQVNINLAPQARSVGLMFQDYALFPHLTAQDNIALAIDKTLPQEQRVQRTKALLSLVNLENLEARLPSALSGGQRQRVALARALARNPEVLLLDEPFSAVDHVTRERLKRELAILRTQLNIPMLLVTHDLNEAMALADSIAVLHHGQLLDCDSSENIRLRPSTPVVARLMGQYNLFSGVMLKRSCANDAGTIGFGEVILEVEDTGPFETGAAISWMVASEHVVLHRRGRPSHGEHENPITGSVVELTRLGDQTDVLVALDAASDAFLRFRISSHVAERNDLQVRGAITVSLLAQGIHLMEAASS